MNNQSAINYSIVIPHYNVPHLLVRCLKSIPVREDVQVIVVDDCSNGAERFLERYPELSRPYLEFYRIDHRTNAGHARNVGLSHARGKWLIFADADDYFIDGFDAVLDKYVNDEADIIYFKNKEVSTVEGRQIEGESGDNYLVDLYLESGDDYLLRQMNYCPWGKIIRHEMVQQHDIRFHEVKYSNDVYFSCACACFARKIKCIDSYLYKYVRRKMSLSSSMLSKEDVIIRVDEYFAAHSLMVKQGWDVNKALLFRFASFALSANDLSQWRRYLVKIHKEYGIPKSTVIIWSIYSLALRIFHSHCFDYLRNNALIVRIKEKVLRG